jgi:hypothetical protein
MYLKYVVQQKVAERQKYRSIKRLCDIRKIRYRVSEGLECLEIVKSMRNSLAHGSKSFTQCASNLSVNDLEHYKAGTPQETRYLSTRRKP